VKREEEQKDNTRIIHDEVLCGYRERMVREEKKRDICLITSSPP
jgi:hypothetical protein